MNIEQIECLLTILDTGNFSEAGERLNISQSAVSKKIRALEKELGVELIDRKEKRGSLSETGNLLIKQFFNIIEAYEEIKEKIETKNNENASKNRLKIIGVPAIKRYRIIKLACAFAKKHPEVELTIEEQETDKIPLMAKNTNYDLVFGADTTIDHMYYNNHYVLTDTFMAAVNTKNPLSDRDEIAFADLKDMQLVLNGPTSWMYRMCTQACNKAGFEPKIIYTTTRPETALEFVHNSVNSVYLGIGRAITDTPSPRHKVLTVLNSPKFDFVFAWRKDRPLSQIAKDFLVFAEESGYE